MGVKAYSIPVRLESNSNAIVYPDAVADHP